jgi:hypothetical protein
MIECRLIVVPSVHWGVLEHIPYGWRNNVLQRWERTGEILLSMETYPLAFI